MTSLERRRLVLHVGQTKAGSTAIQNYLENQRSALANQGVLFPSVGFSRGNPFDQERTSGHLSMVRSIAAGQTSELERELSDVYAHTVLVSAENLFLDRPDKELEALKNFFKFYDIEVVLVLRDPLRWVKSIYSEEVLSGFFCRTDTFKKFMEDKLHSNSLVYSDRIAYLNSLLEPREWHLVNYDSVSHEDGIIGAFLASAGVPCTDDNLAASLRANVREKEAFLVEGKRRLNYALSNLPIALRLKFESIIREKSKEISRALSGPVPLFSCSPVPLSHAACSEIRKSNDRIAQQFGLADALQNPSPYTGRTDFSNLQGASELVAFGFKVISEMCCAVLSGEQSTKYLDENLNTLYSLGSSMLLDLLQKVTVSWHLSSYQTSIWAAAHPGKLPIVILGALQINEINQVLPLELPSHVICLNDAEEANRLLPQHAPEVLVASPYASPDDIEKAWHASGGKSVLALIGHDRESVSALEDLLDLKVVDSDGRTYFLSAQGC